MKNSMSVDKKWVIFDLDGTLADISVRRKSSEKPNGKLDWDIFFSDKLVSADKPNQPVIEMAKALHAQGYQIAIFSGRSASSQDITKEWLHQHNVPFNLLRMRPTVHPFKFMPDEKLKQDWFNEVFANPVDMDEAEVVAVFDDRDKVVNMWREIGLTCMQVAPGNF